MKMRNDNGYTLIELMLVVVILSLLTSILTPRFGQLLQKSFQAKARSNLGFVRSAIALYYSDQEGRWPLANYPEGLAHYTTHGKSMTGVLVPKYTEHVPTPYLLDNMPTVNEVPVKYDNVVKAMMELTPPKDVFIIHGPADYTPLLISPFAYDNNTGLIYYPNGNYTSVSEYFYLW